MAPLTWSLQAASASAACSRVHSVAIITMFWARTRSFSLLCLTSTMRFWYTLPAATMAPVEIMFRTSFCAVPALRRVEPVWQPAALARRRAPTT